MHWFVNINLTIPVQYRGIRVMSAKTPSLLKPPHDASIYLPPLPFPCTSPFPCSVPALLPSAFHQVNNIAPSALNISLYPPPRSTLPSAVAAKRNAPCNRTVCISPIFPCSSLHSALCTHQLLLLAQFLHVPTV